MTTRATIILPIILSLCAFAMSAQTALPHVSEETMKILQDAEKKYDDGELDTALELWGRFDVEPQQAHSLGLSDGDLSYVLFCIGRCHKGKGNYYDAIQYLLKSESLINRLMANYLWYVPNLYSATANSYVAVREYPKALEWGQKWLKLTLRKHGNESPELLAPYIFLYYTYRLAGDLPQALDALNKYFTLYFNIGDEPENKDDFISLMLQHATLSYELNQIDKAYEVCKVVEELCDRYETDKTLRLRCCNLMTGIMIAKDAGEAQTYVDKTVELLEEFAEDEMTEDDAMIAINNISVCYMEEDPGEALSLLESIAERFKEKGDKGSAGYALVSNNIGSILGLQDENSIPLFDRAFHLVSSQKGTDVANTLSYGLNWIYSLLYAGRHDELTGALREINEAVSGRLNESFAGLSERNRSLYWNQVKLWYQDVLPYFAVILQSQEAWGILYDGMLQSRSILLGSALSLSSLVEQSHDPVLKRLHTQSSELISIDGSGELVEMLENRLLNEVKNYGNFMDPFTADHKKVRQSLADRDIAVEFVKYSIGYGIYEKEADTPDGEAMDDSDSGDIRYMALIQRPDSEYPLGVDICSEKDLDDWTFESLYEAVWTPILESAGNVGRIYFSPDGKIFSLPIEYAIDRDSTMLNEKMELFRLSSTREIVFDRKTDVNRIALFGGMKFDLNVDDMVADAALYRDATAEMVRTRGTRGAILTFEPLPATKVEVENIQTAVDTVSPVKIDVSVFSGEKATEAAFKSCSGKDIGILHVATHGFYDSDMHASQDDINDEADIINFEQDNMRRSGILFSGADNVRMGEPVPPGVEDGVLDSFEITNLDFRKTDLVVLSACKTALGVVSGDGVFGLQRGFKKAGVNSILMSLWKVDDEATCYFMSEFYKHLLSEPSCHDKVSALRKAQRAVRQVPGWSHPRYWAAFILLDALH